MLYFRIHADNINMTFIMTRSTVINCYCYRYARCSAPAHTPVERPFSNGVTKVFRSLTRRLRPRIPRVVMFGSGLESIPLVRNMLWENSSPYRPVRLFPGKEGKQLFLF